MNISALGRCWTGSCLFKLCRNHAVFSQGRCLHGCQSSNSYCILLSAFSTRQVQSYSQISNTVLPSICNATNILKINPMTEVLQKSFYCTNNQKVSDGSSEELVLSQSCIDRLKQLKSTNNDSKDTFLRLVVEGGGCSGFQYKFELDDELKDDDKCFGPNDAMLVADEVSLSFIKGSKIEYHKELIRAAFRVVNNPQSEAGCSCGASFSIKI